MDVYKEALNKLRILKVNQWGLVSDFAPNKPELFVQIVKSLIRSGYSEYEFSNDYTAIRRLDLPEYARDYFKKLVLNHEQSKQNNERSDTVAKNDEKPKP